MDFSRPGTRRGGEHTCHATEVVRSTYEIIDANLVGEFVDHRGSDLQNDS